MLKFKFYSGFCPCSIFDAKSHCDCPTNADLGQVLEWLFEKSSRGIKNNRVTYQDVTQSVDDAGLRGPQSNVTILTFEGSEIPIEKALFEDFIWNL